MRISNKRILGDSRGRFDVKTSLTPGVLIIFSGLPGSGKSTLASMLATRLRATYLRIDTVEQGLRDLCGMTDVNGKGYALSYRLAEENLRLGNLVIADSVNPEDFTRKEWNSVAEETGAHFVNVEIVCSDKDEHRHRAEIRGPSARGLKNPTWEEIVNRDYHAWTEERIQIDTRGKSVVESFQELAKRIDLEIDVRVKEREIKNLVIRSEQ